ncbi:hypothetical protein EG327_002246 [Venturia inaequalis]|uniref:Heme haloperoxidase family profile domain-containing protein n=2 Tax=Venturia inaequalis TaxID=5025 RepID=A0A8H3VMZ8_VENIN|nr:hypothetical protein EG327_002246 [Venturia inaequalis]
MYTRAILLAAGLTTSCLALPQFNGGNPRFGNENPRFNSSGFNNGPSQNNLNDGPFSGPHDWIPASRIEGSTRSSCPFLNTAANHAFLPRNGRQISKAQFDRAQMEALNFAPDFASAISTGMLSKLNLPLDTTLFDLDQLNAHSITEHDASITRLDKNQGNNIVVNPPLVFRFLEDSSLPWLNTSSVARTRNRRTRESRAAGNPALDQGGLAAAQGEAALVLLTMSDEIGTVTAANADALKCPKARVQRWLLDERFPVVDGFKKPRRQVAASENAALVERLTFWEGQAQNGGRVGGEDRGDGGMGVGVSGMGDGGHGGLDSGRGGGGFYGGNNGGFNGGNNGGFNGGNNGGRPGGFSGGNNGGREGGFSGGNNGGREGGFNGGNNGGRPGGFDGQREGGFNGGSNGGREGGFNGGSNGGREGGFNGGFNGGREGGLNGGFNGGREGGLNGGFNGGREGGLNGGFNGGREGGFNGGSQGGPNGGYNGGYNGGGNGRGYNVADNIIKGLTP